MMKTKINYEKLLRVIISKMVEAEGRCYCPDYEDIQNSIKYGYLDEDEQILATLTKADCEAAERILEEAIKAYDERFKTSTFFLNPCNEKPLNMPKYPNLHMQYWFVSDSQNHPKEYENDGWIYRQCNGGPFLMWAIYNCESDIPYEHRNGLIRSIGRETVETEYDSEKTPPHAVPISSNEAKRIMKKWRRLSKKAVETYGE